MKYVKIIGVLWLCLSIITTTVAQQRRIILSHGFNGNSDTWQAYQPKLGQMLTTVGQQRVDIVNYNSRRGVEAGKQEVAGQVANNNQNIAIVHSMGGLVWRELDRLNPGQKAGGIITLGTPNRGGAMVNAMRSGFVQAEFQDGCNKTANAISSGLTAISATGLVGAAVGTVFGNTAGSVANRLVGQTGSVLDIFGSFLCVGFISYVNTLLPPETAPRSAIDMSVGSTIVNNLNSSNTPTPKIGLFGVEESPVHIRLMGSYRKTPSLQPLGGDNTDADMVDAFNLMRDVVLVGEITFIVATIIYSWNAIWNWSALYPAIACAWAAYDWAMLGRWLAQSESKWHALIGAGGSYTETVNFRLFTCMSTLDDAYDLYDRRRMTAAQLRLIETRLYADPNCFTMMQVPIQFPINYQSDGLFNAGTARIPTDPNDERHVINLPVDGANHQELLNHRNMTIRFREIFSGQTRANSFFITQ